MITEPLTDWIEHHLTNQCIEENINSMARLLAVLASETLNRGSGKLPDIVEAIKCPNEHHKLSYPDPPKE